MVALAEWYTKSKVNALQGNIKIGTNPIKAAWFKNAYALAVDTDNLFSGLANESTGTNYAGGGNLVTGVSVTPIAANAWTVTAAVATAYVVDNIVKPVGGNGFLYRCVTAGTSAGAAPTWPLVYGNTVADGTVVWENLGRAVIVFTGTVTGWVNMTSTDFRYLVFYDTVTSALICVYDTAAAQSVAGQNVTFTPDPLNGIALDSIR